MKFTTIYLGETKIVLFNSILGVETIKVNDIEVSSKFSITGTEHKFKVLEDEKEIECRLITGLGLHGAVIDLYKGGKPVIESPRNAWLWLLFNIILILILIRII